MGKIWNRAFKCFLGGGLICAWSSFMLGIISFVLFNELGNFIVFQSMVTISVLVIFFMVGFLISLSGISELFKKSEEEK